MTGTDSKSLPSAQIKPTNLHFAHSWGGGLGRWIESFAGADGYAENLVLESCSTLECFGLSYCLQHPKSRTTLNSWVLHRPISEMRSSHGEYAAILESICSDFGITHIYISSLIGHSYDVFRLGLPVTKIYHDYSTYCPALYIYRDGICTTCTTDDLQLCKKVNHFPPKNSPRYYLELREDFFAAVEGADVRHVAPSPSVPRHLRELDSRFEDFEFAIIEHGISFPKRDCFGGAEDGQRLQVGVLGHLNWNKGLAAMRQLFDTLRLIADIHFIGAHDAGSEFINRWGSSYVHEYTHNELPQILDRYQLDLTLFLPIVPETFSYTLSETWSFCLPPAAQRIGALADRIEDGCDGFLLDRSDEAVVDFLLYVDRDRDALRRVAAHLRDKPVRTIDHAIRDYYLLRTDYPAQLDQSLGQALTALEEAKR